MSSYRNQVAEFEQVLQSYKDDLGIVWFSDVAHLKSPKPPPLDGEATPSELASLDWEMLRQREPELDAFYEKWVNGRDGQSWTELWGREMRSELEWLIGWYADTTDPILRSEAAWRVAYRYLYRAVEGEYPW